MKRLYHRIFCFMIAAIVAMPILLTAINFTSVRLWDRKLIDEAELSGVINVPPRPQFSATSLLSGQFQSEFEKYLEYNLATRKTGTRAYNQALHSLFNSTDSASVVVGRENYLYESLYPAAYLTEVPSWATPALTEKIKELAELDQLLKERGVVLVVRMSPTKAEHYPEYLPAGYSRFVDTKRRGEYGPNWYEVFKEEIAKTDVPYYDRYDLIQQMKQDGHIVFTKGGTHWSLYPMAEYINGFNEYLEGLLGKKLGRITVTSAENKNGQMGIPEDRDIWDICWNALSVKPNYPSPNVTFGMTRGEFAPKVFTVGQSFSTILLSVIYNNMENPVWDETYFSWYNSYVLRYPNPDHLPWGERVEEETKDFEQYLNMDIIMIEFLETGANPDATQFAFVSNMLNYLKSEG